MGYSPSSTVSLVCLVSRGDSLDSAPGNPLTQHRGDGVYLKKKKNMAYNHKGTEQLKHIKI